MKDERREESKKWTERANRALTVRKLNPLGEVGRTLTAGLAASASVFVLPAGTGVGVYLAMPWNVWALTYLTLTWVVILHSSPRQTRQWARAQREVKGGWLPNMAMAIFQVGRTGGLHFIVIVSQMGLWPAVVLLLPQVRDGSLASASLIVLSALGVVAAWAVLNTAYALYYAYLYYGGEENAGGLDFPGDGEPGMLDFAYFSFTVGTSFAASDVQVRSRTARGVVLGHTILSFAYNAILIAVVVNAVSDL